MGVVLDAMEVKLPDFMELCSIVRIGFLGTALRLIWTPARAVFSGKWICVSYENSRQVKNWIGVSPLKMAVELRITSDKHRISLR